MTHTGYSISIDSLLFQSTLPQGEWQNFHVRFLRSCLFQSTLPQGEWLSRILRISAHMIFQSTLPQGEWHVPDWAVKAFKEDFNPHSRKGSDRYPLGISLKLSFISIHTPARGVTLYSINPVHHLSLFQSTLPQGEWLPGNVIYSGGFNFNPHSRKGSDSGNFLNMSKIFYFNPHSRKGSDFGITVIAITKIISIHTPARGVTSDFWNKFRPQTGFQSTLPQGEWRDTATPNQNSKIFQSTLPQGEWHW